MLARMTRYCAVINAVAGCLCTVSIDKYGTRHQKGEVSKVCEFPGVKTFTVS